MGKLIAVLVMCGLLAGCVIGPDYHRPDAKAPAKYRGLSEEQAQAEAASLGDQKWWEVFQDEQLQALIRAALAQNYDVKIAAARILEAEAQQGLVAADQLPQINLGAAASQQRGPIPGIVGPVEARVESLNLNFTWDVPFWGKYRRATEAAQANLLASEWARRAVLGTLVSNIASAYFQLRELDLELDISKKALASRQDSLRLTKTLADHGAAPLLDVRQAEQLVYTAAEAIPDLEKRITQQENLIHVLMGENPDAVTRGGKLTDQPHPPEVPAGLTSDLIERRPDIRQAEQQLILLNANIGIAKSAYFPDIKLTANEGFASDALGTLFRDPANVWNFGAGLTQPIFDAGRNYFGVKLAEAQHQEALLNYQKTIREAFREVADALVAYQKNQDFTKQQQLLANAAESAAQLSDIRYKGGATSYLEVLTNETNTFTADLGLARAQLNELLALVQIYNALGGGWEQ